MQSHLPSPVNHRFYFDYGTGTLDSAYESYQQMIDFTMTAKGYDKSNWITLRFSGADHSEKAWRSRLAGPLYFLLRRL
jgi:hypothetical protein